MQKLNSRFALFIAALFVVSVSAVIGLKAIQKNNENNSVQGENTTNSVEVRIKEDQKKPAVYSLPYQENGSAYDLLKRLDSQEESLKIVYNEYDFNGKKSYFVVRINGYKPNINERFWKFVVNGSDSMTGISDYTVNSGDTLKFELDEIAN